MPEVLTAEQQLWVKWKQKVGSKTNGAGIMNRCLLRAKLRPTGTVDSEELSLERG